MGDTRRTAAFNSFFREAENYRVSKELPDKKIEVKVAEILAIGCRMDNTPELVIVRDTEGKIWAIPETDPNDKNILPENQLVSRYDVREGFKIRFLFKKRIIEEKVISQVSVVE